MDRRYLFTGKAGTGKSAIAEMLGRAFVTHELWHRILERSVLFS